MRVCIITLVGYFNYGNRLQNYALQEALKELSCTQVDTMEVVCDNNILKQFFKRFIERTASGIHLINIKDVSKEYKLQKFTKKYINNRRWYNKDRFITKEINESYDVFIVGSDQVWNPYYWSGNKSEVNNFLLCFADDGKKMSYAASFGVSKIGQEYLGFFKTALQSFIAISVREYDGADIVSSLVNRKAEVVVDPTLLLSANEWRKISSKRLLKNKYILLYFLGDDSNEMTFIQQYAQENCIDIINIMNTNCKYYSASVEDFLSLIDNAEIVVTDSFHAMVFSIIFHTNFVVCNRVQNNQKDMSSRLTTLLSKFHLENRRGLFSELYFQECDFSNTDQLLEKYRSDSIKWLKHSLDIIRDRIT